MEKNKLNIHTALEDISKMYELVNFSIKLERFSVDMLKTLSDKENISNTQLVKNAIEAYLLNLDENTIKEVKERMNIPNNNNVSGELVITNFNMNLEDGLREICHNSSISDTSTFLFGVRLHYKNHINLLCELAFKTAFTNLKKSAKTSITKFLLSNEDKIIDNIYRVVDLLLIETGANDYLMEWSEKMERRRKQFSEK